LGGSHNRFRQFIAATESFCGPLPRVTPHGMESSGTSIIDLRDRMPIVDDRPREHAGEIGKIDDAAAKAEVATMRAAVYGKDKI